VIITKQKANLLGVALIEAATNSTEVQQIVPVNGDFVSVPLLQDEETVTDCETPLIIQG
jgi:hypothetical protein